MQLRRQVRFRQFGPASEPSSKNAAVPAAAFGLSACSMTLFRSAMLVIVLSPSKVEENVRLQEEKRLGTEWLGCR
jgi:hypothetical protein